MSVIARGQGSLKFQIIKDLDPLQSYGESKFKAKQIERERCEREGRKYVNGSAGEKIYSTSTYDTYKKECIRFGEWAKKEHGIKHIDDLKEKEVVKEYLEHRESQGDSAWTLRTMGSAIAKMCRCKSTDFEYKYPERNRNDISRSREERHHDKEFSKERHKDTLDFLRGSGLRRKEASLIRPEQIQERRNEVVIVFDKEKYGIQTKGGRDRITHIREEYRQHVIEMRDRAIRDNKERMFIKEQLPNRMDIHSYRREYVEGRYNEIKHEHELMGIEVKNDYHTRDGSGRHFNKAILLEVSRDLGHNRIGVVVSNYLK